MQMRVFRSANVIDLDRAIELVGVGGIEGITSDNGEAGSRDRSSRAVIDDQQIENDSLIVSR